MVNGLYTSGRSMMDIVSKQELASNALANTNTPGFKVSRLATRTEIRTGQEIPEKAWRQQERQSPDEVYTDWRQGPMIPTGNPLDLALQGDGFFAVQTPQGTRYSRAMNLRIEGGMLVDLSGCKILSTEGKVIRVGTGAVQVLPDGRVQVDGEERAQLSVVDFPKPYALRSEGAGHLVPFAVNGKTPSPKPASPETHVASGALEGSNVNSVEAMVQMIAFFRNYEADSKVIHAVDSTLDRAINQVARV
jgi:flagellar basal-body rod protein FlgG